MGWNFYVAIVLYVEEKITDEEQSQSGREKGEGVAKRKETKIAPLFGDCVAAIFEVKDFVQRW